MYMRTIATLILGIIASANLVIGQSLAEVAEKEKKRRENNNQEATVVVKNRGVWLVGEEPNPEGEDSAKPVGDSKNRPAGSKKKVDECRVAQDSLDGLKRNQRNLETRLLQLRRKAQSARILDSHGRRELEADEWRVPAAEATEILGALTAVRAGLDDTASKIDTYLKRLAEDCQ